MKKRIEEIKKYRRKWYDNRASVYDKLWWESEESKEEIEDSRSSFLDVKSFYLFHDKPIIFFVDWGSVSKFLGEAHRRG